MSGDYSETAPERSAIDATAGPLVLEFGSNACGICLAARPLIEQAMADYPELAHIRVQDGKGRRLGRSFTVKFWPTLIMLRDGQELLRVVRPGSLKELTDALDLLLEPPANSQ